MFNSKYIIVALTSIICLYSCNNSGKSGSSNIPSEPTIMITNDSVIISTTSERECNISINALNENVVSCQINKTTSYSLLDLARKCKDKNEIALSAVNNNNTILFKIKVGNVIDTLVNYTIEPFYEDNSFSISGKCAPLFSKFSNPSQSVDIKKWLFRKKAHLEDKQVHTLIGLINQLSKSGTTEYISTTDIPIIKSFSGIKYKVKSNLIADYYVLYACSSADEIEEFVEDVVANDFELCTKSLAGSMDCYRKADSNGNKCVCLIAIKNDWSYKIQPLGLVAIDNIAPSSLNVNSNEITSIAFPNNVKVTLPANKPTVFGYANVGVGHWDGTGLSCACTFILSYGGDASSITIHRTGKLAEYLGVIHKKIDLSEHCSPYSITMDMHLDDGDNRIPITISDNLGNTRKDEINIRAEFVRTNTNDINIDNNINIWD